MDVVSGLLIWLMYMVVIFGSTVLVATLIANYLNLSGLYWWAVVIVCVLILNSLISGFKD